MIIFFVIILIFLTNLLNNYLKKQRFNIDQKTRFNCLIRDYSYCYILWTIILGLAIYLLTINNLYKYLLITLSAVLSFFFIIYLYQKNFNAKKHFEFFQITILSITTLIGIAITAIITISIFIETWQFFKLVDPRDFFFGLSWNPQMAINSDQEVGASSFGIIPVFLGTILITCVAMFIAVPIGIMSAIYLAMYAKNKTRDIVKPILEILAGVPTVVYGYFAVTVIAPSLKYSLAQFGIEISAESALSAGFVMGIMIIPFVLSLTDDALISVPQSLKDGALALGSTKSEMIKKVVLVQAFPNIIGAIILAISRAIGETMIVVMSAGLVAKLSFNPLDSVTTATAQIVTLLVGDQEFNSPKTLSAFALALTLFIFTFILNIIALAVIKKYKRY